MYRGIHLRGNAAIGMGDFWSDRRDELLGKGSKEKLQQAATKAIATAVETAIQSGTKTPAKNTVSPSGGVMTATAPPAASGGVIQWIKDNPLPAAFTGGAILLGIHLLTSKR